jgi:tetratricopeptide (TPR) repeat protein
MPLPVLYIFSALAGLVAAHFISRPPELRAMRLAQLLFVPCGTVICFQGSLVGGMPGFIIFMVGLFFLIVLLAPNLSYFMGMGVANFLDPQDWTPLEEEIALKPVRDLIDRGNYRQALAELERLLAARKPTYEAVLTRAKLLNHIGRVNEAEGALLQLIGLSQSGPQQLSVMEMLSSLETLPPDAPPAAVSGTRDMEIGHEFVLFQLTAEKPRPHREIAPGKYRVEEIIYDNQSWLKLAGEDWGNAKACWEAIPVAATANVSVKKGVFYRIAQAQQSLTVAIKGKPHRQRVADAQALFKEANQLIRNNEWQRALPLLEQASKANPDKYEYAYRWLQAAGQTAGAPVLARVTKEVLEQSQWSKSEETMLKQLAGEFTK